VALASPELALGVAAALVVAGTINFAATPASRRWRGTRQPESRGALASAGMRTLLVSSVMDGMTFGTLEVALPAFAQRHGPAGMAGVLLAVLGLASMLGGLWYGTRSWTTEPEADPVVLVAAARRSRAARSRRLDPGDGGVVGAGGVLDRTRRRDHFHADRKTRARARGHRGVHLAEHRGDRRVRARRGGNRRDRPGRQRAGGARRDSGLRLQRGARDLRASRDAGQRLGSAIGTALPDADAPGPGYCCSNQ
jgi:hypothetical protein